MIRIAAATLSARAPPPMSRKLAGSPPARLTRSIVVIARPAPLTMQPIVPSSLMKVSPASRASRSAGSSSSGSRSCLELGVAGEGGVVERDLGVQADQALDGRARRVGLADDRQRIDLDEVGVVGEHRPDEALGDRDRRLEVAAEAHRERELRAPGSRAARASGRRGRGRSPRAGRRRPARSRRHPRPSPSAGSAARPGRARPTCSTRLTMSAAGATSTLRTGMPLMSMPRIVAGDALGLVRVAGQLHAAGLAASADQHLRLDHDGARAVAEEALGRRARLGARCGRPPRRGPAAPGRGAATWRRLPGSSRGDGLRWHG